MIKKIKTWLKHRANTIRYKCPNCKTRLETDNSESGGIDTCPNCNELHRVPRFFIQT